MNALNASFFGIQLSMSNDTLMTILWIVEAVILLLIVALLIYVLARKKPTEAQEEVAVAEPEPLPEPEPEPLPEPEPEPEPVPVPQDEFELRPVKGFMAKYILSTDDVKARYGAVKNAALGYEKMRCRASFKRETFYHGRDALMRIAFRGKTLCMYFAIDPAPFDGTKYHVEDVSELHSYEDTPCMIRITGSRKEKYAKELIAMLMEAYGIPAIEREDEDYYLPMREEAELEEEGLIKHVKTRVSASPFAQKDDDDEQGDENETE